MALNVNDNKFSEIAKIIYEEGLSGLDKAVQIIHEMKWTRPIYQTASIMRHN
jgi:hypothetical protein